MVACGVHEFKGMRLRARGQPITSGDKAEKCHLAFTTLKASASLNFGCG
jgi:hypothetical protein